MCNYVSKSLVKCNIKKTDEYGFCCRHYKSKQSAKNNIKNESEKELPTNNKRNSNEKVETINIKKANDPKYDVMYEVPEKEQETENVEGNLEVVEEKKPATENDIKLLKYAYLAIVGWIENKNPEKLAGSTAIISQDAMIDQALKEVADDYSTFLGMANIRADVRLLIFTTMAFGIAAGNNNNVAAKSTPSSYNDNERNKKIEEEFSDI